MDEQTQSLYRKWRSQTFAELVGQDAVTQTLRHAVAEGRLAHAYLFCGPRGTGKTSSARLLAKMVNCERPSDGEPCNACPSCREVIEGRSTDVFEIDAASNRGIDEIRDLRERVRVNAGIGHTRVYIVDEVHMLTEAAFNALLKTLEEPPPRVVFVLATTEAHKVPATVASRCQRFDFRRISLRGIVEHLTHVAAAEGMRAEPAALEVIARAAQGGMRDALSLLDQARAFAGDTLTAESARGMLGMADPALVRDLVRFVAQGDTAAGLHRINDLAQGGTDLRQLAGQIGDLWRQLMLARAGADLERVMDLAPEDVADRREMANLFELPALAECARVFARNDTGPHTQIVPQLALELAFLDCVTAARPQPARREAIVESAAAYAARPPAPADLARPSAPAEQPRPAPEAIQVDAPPSAPSVVSRPTTPTAPPPTVPVAVNGYAAPPVTPPAAAPHGVASATDSLLAKAQEQWELIKKVCLQHSSDHSITGKKVHGQLNGGNAYPVGLEQATVPVIVIVVEYPALGEQLKKPVHAQVVKWALATILETDCDVRFISKDEALAYGGTRSAAPSAATSERPAPSAASPERPATPAITPERPAPPTSAPPPAPPDNQSQPVVAAASPSVPVPDPHDLAERDPLVASLKRDYQAAIKDIQPIHD